MIKRRIFLTGVIGHNVRVWHVNQPLELTHIAANRSEVSDFL